MDERSISGTCLRRSRFGAVTMGAPRRMTAGGSARSSGAIGELRAASGWGLHEALLLGRRRTVVAGRVGLAIDLPVPEAQHTCDRDREVPALHRHA